MPFQDIHGHDYCLKTYLKYFDISQISDNLIIVFEFWYFIITKDASKDTRDNIFIEHCSISDTDEFSQGSISQAQDAKRYFPDILAPSKSPQ